MALLGLHRGDILIHGINGEQSSLLWDRLLFPMDGMSAVHFWPLRLGPATTVDPAPTADGHSEPTLPMPVDADTPAPGQQDSDGSGSGASPAGGTSTPPIEIAADPLDGQAPFSNPPYSLPSPIADSPTIPASAPGDSAPPAGHIPKSDALIWSGPAIMAFPPDSHETSGDAAAPGGGDLSAAFLPPDGGDLADLPHGLDLGFALTPPLPPPPDMI